MRRIIPAVLLLSVVFFGCRVKELAEKAKIAKDLEKHGTIDLMKDVSKDKYDPPKDGKLTEAQIQMYLKVRQHEKDIAKVAKEQMDQHSKAAGEFFTTDIRADKDLGYNTQEYLWVKGQIMAASVTAFAEGLTNAMSAQQDAYLAQTRKAYEEAKDEQTKQMYKQMLDSYAQTVKEGKEATANQDPALVYNRQLLKKYDNELAAFTNELGKYENKEGEAKQSVDELQKKLDEATQGKQSQ